MFFSGVHTTIKDFKDEFFSGVETTIKDFKDLKDFFLRLKCLIVVSTPEKNTRRK